MIDLLVEGDLDLTVAVRILAQIGLPAGRPFGRSGRADLFERLPRYNNAALHSPWWALVDLEATEQCLPGFVSDRLPHPNRCMRFRVAVHAIESWLLADREMLAEFLKVSAVRMPLDPDTVPHPKRSLIDIARHSRSADIRFGVVPRPGSGASQGPLYTTLMQNFVTNLWRPNIAAENSPSLRRCMLSLPSLADCLAD